MSLKTDLMAHWKLNEASGTRFDSHGSNHLTDNNTVTSATGKIGDAASFAAASSEHLSRSDNTDLSVGTGVSFTFACWVQLSSSPATRAIAGKLATSFAAANLEWALSITNSVTRFQVSDGTTVKTQDVSGALSTGTWYFLLCWYDDAAKTVNVSVNNGAASSSSWTGGVRDGSAGFAIGRFGEITSFYWDGLIDSCSFWKRVLTSDERTALYNSGNGLDYEDFEEEEVTYGDIVATGNIIISGTSLLNAYSSIEASNSIVLNGIVSLTAVGDIPEVIPPNTGSPGGIYVDARNRKSKKPFVKYY